MPKFLFILKREYLGCFYAKGTNKAFCNVGNGLNRFFIGVNEYDSYEMLTFASWKTKVC